MADVAQACRASGAKSRALHDARVELDLTVGVEARADAGVEERLVLHVPHGHHGGGECAQSDRGPAGVPGALDGGLAKWQLRLRDGASAAMNDQRRTGQSAAQYASACSSGQLLRRSVKRRSAVRRSNG